MKEITPTQLHNRLEKGDTIQVIDIRELHERDICLITEIHYPMAEIMDNVTQIRRDCDVVIHCRTGKRSAAVIYTLEVKYGFDNLLNLSGGILAWVDEVNPEMEKY